VAWVELAVVVPRARLEAVSARLFAFRTPGLQEDVPPGAERPPRQVWDAGPEPPPPARVLLRAWFEDPDRAAIAAGLRPLLEPGAQLAWADAPDVPWEEAWKADLTPIRVGADLVVAPPWDAPPGAVTIEPGQGFGTGHHPTTRAVLDELVAVAPACRTALDVGCGSGILALAAARLGLSARGLDVDPDAVAEARRNAERNGLPVAFATTPVAELAAGADLVLANLHAEVLGPLAPELARLTGRWLVASGLLADRAAAVVAALDAAGLSVVRRRDDGRWVTLRLERS